MSIYLSTMVEHFREQVKEEVIADLNWDAMDEAMDHMEIKETLFAEIQRVVDQLEEEIPKEEV